MCLRRSEPHRNTEFWSAPYPFSGLRNAALCNSPNTAANVIAFGKYMFRLMDSFRVAALPSLR